MDLPKVPLMEIASIQLNLKALSSANLIAAQPKKNVESPTKKSVKAPVVTKGAKEKVSVKTIERERQKAYRQLNVRSTAEMTRVVILGSLHDVVFPAANRSIPAPNNGWRMDSSGTAPFPTGVKPMNAYNNQVPNIG